MEQRIYGERYEITNKIGMGGMAEVFKAKDLVLERTVAVKVMLPQYASDTTFAARFRQEAQAAANLSSPYIVSVYDWGQAYGSYYIVMEYVHGTDLKSAIEKRGAIHPRKVAEIGAQVCSALTVAHSHHIIHRDIKSANIMMQTDGNIKVMDFGIAQAGNTGLTQDSSVLGTAHYVSPEQAQGKPLTPATDLYSLGIVMYEMATGQLPFDGPDAVSVAVKQVNEPVVPPRQINPNIPVELENIIMRALSKNLDIRYQTAREMENDLEAFLSGTKISNAKTVAMGAVTDEYAPGSTTVMPKASDKTRVMDSVDQDQPVGTTKKKNKSKKKIIAIIVAILIVIGAGIGVAASMGAFAEKQIVPDVTGMTLEEATDELEKYNLEVGDVKREASDLVEEGLVIRQDPEGNDAVTEGSQIDLVISSGKAKGDMIPVPDVLGYTPSEAKAEIEAAGFVAVQDKDYSDDYEEGKICAQDPKGGSEAEEGSTITITVSLGKKVTNVDVPEVRGYSKADAVASLEELNFKVNVKYEYSDSVSSGMVISQSIDPGTSVSEGSSITIVVSKGTQTASVPSVVGLTEEEATARLSEKGFSVTVKRTSGAEGEVVNQSPGANVSATPGSRVTIYVGNGN